METEEELLKIRETLLTQKQNIDLQVQEINHKLSKKEVVIKLTKEDIDYLVNNVNNMLDKLEMCGESYHRIVSFLEKCLNYR